MIPVLLIPWAALAICAPIVKAMGVAEHVRGKKKERGRVRVSDAVDGVRNVHTAEKEAYAHVASALTGAFTATFGEDEPPEVVVQGVSLALKGVTMSVKPSFSDLTDLPTSDDAND